MILPGAGRLYNAAAESPFGLLKRERVNLAQHHQTALN